MSRGLYHIVNLDTGVGYQPNGRNDSITLHFIP